MADREYKRLTRSRLRRKGWLTVVSTRSSLWLGKDHLLSIDSSGYVEEYKRFYFRDIQAILLRANRRRMVLNIILGLLTFLCAGGWILAFVSRSEFDLRMAGTAMVFTSFFLVPLIWNNLLGPTCHCRIRTAVQEEEIPSLSRVKRVNKVLQQIRPLITEAQNRAGEGNPTPHRPEPGINPAGGEIPRSETPAL